MLVVALTVFDMLKFYIFTFKKDVKVTEYNFRTNAVRWQM